MRLRYTDALVVLAAVAAGVGYWFWSQPPEPMGERRGARSLHSGSGFRSVTFPPRGKRALTVTNEGLAEWWDPESGEGSAQDCCPATEGVLAFIRNGEVIAASGPEPVLWDAHSRKPMARLAGDGAPAGFGPVAFDAIREWILMGSRDGRVYA